MYHNNSCTCSECRWKNQIKRTFIIRVKFVGEYERIVLMDGTLRNSVLSEFCAMQNKSIASIEISEPSNHIK
jgi:hypothetical protein